MKREVRIDGKKRLVEIDRQGDRWVCRIDGKPVEADPVEVSPDLYSILLCGRSFEVRVESRAGLLDVQVGRKRMSVEVIDSRLLRRHHGGVELEGSQQIAAPMPGKIVRVLIGEGQPVQAGQGILVLEAMKMQNEVRSPKSGTVERLLVTEGQTVNAGDAIAVIA